MTSSTTPSAPDGPDDAPRSAAAHDAGREAEGVETAVDDVAAPEDGTARGVRALAGDRFSVAEAVGGVRGLVESVAPGLVFVVVFVATTELTWSLVASVAVAVVAVVARLAQRTPLTQALGGLLGVAIGVVWAWRSGDAQDYFAWGLWTNAAYLVALLASLLVRWPLVGLVVEGLRSGFGAGAASPAGADDRPAAGAGGDAQPGAFARWARTWRDDRALLRRYAVATWLWVGLFAARLAVQVPLYLEGSVGWLGTARLVMGLPLWALVLWLTWVLVRRRVV
ncbi:DUF3159 domain-containing protein [Cellulosimicrobium sp. NPDC057127]|uniref:DUF3159 domain-containing protein n=1 Tax=Cellulosimicrobium sp. NPDC057127 TaxID=3346026 RepID=UPI003640C5A5